jgi:hypothetical protein
VSPPHTDTFPSGVFKNVYNSTSTSSYIFLVWYSVRSHAFFFMILRRSVVWKVNYFPHCCLPVAVEYSHDKYAVQNIVCDTFVEYAQIIFYDSCVIVQQYWQQKHFIILKTEGKTVTFWKKSTALEQTASGWYLSTDCCRKCKMTRNSELV